MATATKKTTGGRNGGRLLCAAVLASAVCVPATARAQVGGALTQPKDQPAPPPPPAQPVVTPPVLETDEGAVYPEQAIQDKVTEAVTVDLLLDLDASGAVTKVTVETPRGHGFDEAATTAAQKLRFKPATKNGQAVASRTRHRYAFAPPEARVVGRVTS